MKLLSSFQDEVRNSCAVQILLLKSEAFGFNSGLSRKDFLVSIRAGKFMLIVAPIMSEPNLFSLFQSISLLERKGGP